MCDLFCNVITCCVCSCDTGKIDALDKIMFENQKKENMEIKDILHKSPSKRSFIDIEFTACFIEQMQESADIIYHRPI